MKTRLEFLENAGGEAEGLSDAGIETFRENPFAAAARETGQNSRDARSNPAAPVRVTFDILNIDAVAFPSIDQYRSAAQTCLQKSKKSKKEKEIGFFQNAVRALNEDTIKVLRISDFNTKGVRGPCVEGKPFHTLAKTDGISDKEDIGSLGSFGIGKNAPFALSDIQSVFYSTMYDEDGDETVLCMGKTQFISHTGADGTERRRKGYWGNPDGYMPLGGRAHIPPWLQRSEQGTSIYSICMRENQTDWRFEMAAAILINFFVAVHRSEMEFELDDGRIKINSNTLQTWFNDDRISKSVDELNLRVAFESSRTLYCCLIDNQTFKQTISIVGLGDVNLHMLMRDGLGYTVGIVRNGMYITDNLEYFNEPFKRFPLHRDFAVIIEPSGTPESAWFKRLENPRHDNLSAERITDPDMRAEGRKLFEKLAVEVRNVIRANAKAKPAKSVELEELNEFFVSEEAREEDPAGEHTEPEKKEPSPVRRVAPKKQPPAPQQTGDPDDPPGPGPIPPGPGPVPPGPDPKPRPRKIMKPVELAADRVLIPDRTTAYRRQILFTPETDGTLHLFAEVTGLTTSERLLPTYVSKGSIKGGAIEIDCTAGERVSILVDFDTSYEGPVELLGYQVDKVSSDGDAS